VPSNGQAKSELSRRAAVRRAGAATVAAGLALAASGPAASAQSGSAAGIVGAWRTHVQAGPVRPEVEEMYVFFPGGVFFVVDSPVEPAADRRGGPSNYVGPYAGQWLQLPSGEVRATAVQLNYNVDAIVTAVEYLDVSVRYDGATDTFAGTIDWREETPDGATVFAVAPTHTVTGTPVRVRM
jgi:hypothetical protein